MADRGLDVLEKYGLTALQTGRGRGVVIVTTDKGLVMLSRYQGSEKYIAQINPVLEAVNESGRLCTDSYIATTQGSYIAQSEDHDSYVVRRWYDCRDCNIKSFEDIMWAVRTLALFHNEMTHIDGVAPYTPRSVVDEYVRRNSELRRVKKYLGTRHQKNEFERLAAANCDMFCCEGQAALELIDGYRGEAVKGICHGSYNYHSIFLAKTPVITGIGRLYNNYLITDLYHFMRKLMEKYDWDIKLGYAMIAEYDKERCLSADEVELLGILFAYPEKFWKIINSYYNSNKAWLPIKNYEKLVNVIAQNDKRLSFIKTIH